MAAALEVVRLNFSFWRLTFLLGVSASGVAASQSPTNGEESAPLEKVTTTTALPPACVCNTFIKEEEETQGEEEEDVKRKKTIRKLKKTLRQVGNERKRLNFMLLTR